MKFLSKKGEKRLISEVVILSVIFGLAAGIVGQIITDVYIDPFSQDYFYQNINTNQSIIEIPELRRVKRFLGIEQDFEVNKSVKQALPNLIGIYLKKPPSQDILNQIYLSQDLLGNGFILTSDGWLVTHQLVIGNQNPEQLVVIYQNKQYSIDQLIEDSMTGTVFLKVSASNLPVAILGDSDENNSGQLAVSLNSLGVVVVTNIESPNYQQRSKSSDFVLSSEQYFESILIENNLSESYLGSPLLNLVGEVTGVIKEIDSAGGVALAVPINQFRPVILNVLRDSLVKRPYLGVDYIDLARAVGGEQASNQGALIYRPPLRNSPAADAGLQVDDIIVSIEGQILDMENNLTEIIQQYQPGDELNLEIIRDSKRIDKKVVLSLLPE
ncbi:MAG: hypothetical protein A2731_01060 [Candidatus Buchananbacteria bacterium RIFCSPHIGHO2_01_FULL_39_8]|uniref:PDZ domain-containing protein n=1 Tax=Candidatus Buchananbacteria bacterium RIFCSPHIGHO2_01_FULL_39_8 TaxID=1797533 RepID=A0A1G1Y3L2_9BACT|nr:MAG: hypothetical protein A2731_01060 [Candidatus Buchananbacteria bacterium RIFCSPHIGHO2_01_FULL_39_8]